MTANKTSSKLIWVSGESDEMVSGKYAQRALEILSRHDRLNETSTKSRAAGIAIQYVIPPESIREWEDSVDERIAESDIPQAAFGKTQLPLKNKNLAEFFGRHNTELVDEHEFGEIDNSMFKITLPAELITSIDTVLDDDSTYNLRQKSMFVSNAILAWDSSPFSDCLDRVRTKEQLLKASRGEEVQNPTEAFVKIREGELWEELQEVAKQNGVNDDMARIQPHDEVVLEPEEEPVWTELPKSQSARLGPFLAVLRRFAEEDGDGFGEQFIKQHFDARNGGEDDGEYAHPDKFVDKYVLDHLTQGSDGLWYVDADEAPAEMTDEERKEAIATDIGKARKSRRNSRTLARVCEKQLGMENIQYLTKLAS